MIAQPAPVRLLLVADESNIETGLWCWTCMLPSLVKVPLLILAPDGVGPGMTVLACTNRDHEEPA